MTRRKPTRQQARESYNKSEAPRRIAAEKNDRAAADTAIEAVNAGQGASITNQTARLDSHDTSLTQINNSLTNINSINTNQTSRLDSHDNTLTNMISTNASQTSRLDSHDTSLFQINGALVGKVSTTANEQISGNKLFANLRIFSDGGATVQIRYNSTQGVFGAVI